MTVAEAAIKAGVGETLLRGEIAARRLGCYRIGRRIVVGEHHLAAWLKRCEEPALESIPAPAARWAGDDDDGWKDAVERLMRHGRN